jgi:hypothetical protein
MSFSVSAYVARGLRLGVIGLSVFVGACEGDSGSVSDGGFDRPVIADAPKVDGSTGVFGDTPSVMPEVLPPPPPPPINPAAVKLVGDGWEMLGTHGTGCSHGMPSRAVGGPRWCAISRTGARLGARELWVINATKAFAAPGTVKCETSNPDCLKISEELFSSRPADGPRYPTSHRFYGETLLFYASATSAPSDLFRGTALAWQPGWPAAKPISANNATLCSGHSRANVAWCIVNVTGLDEGQTLTWDEHVGDINNGPMPKISTVYPTHPQTQASQADSLFTVMGDYYAWSTPPNGGSATSAPPESLWYIKTADIKPGVAPAGIKVADGISNFTVNYDNTKYFYMRQYNYNTDGSPSGTLYMADFPAGTNEVMLASANIPSGNTKGVGAYRMLIDQDGAGKGIGFLTDVVLGKGNYKILKDPADLVSPTAVINVINGSLGLPLPSGNLIHSYYATTQADMIATTDSNVTKNDGTVGCSLQSQPTSALFGFPFTKSAALAFWMDNYDQATDSGQGWMASAANCQGKRMFTSNVDYWFVNGDDALLYSDEGDGQTAALKYAPITNLSTVGTGQPIQRQINRTFWILPNYEGVIYGITSTSAAANGIYYAKLPPEGAPPATDASTPADAADAAVDVAAGN